MRINTYSRGLLGLLGVSAGGASPPEFDESVTRPDIDITPFLSATALRVYTFSDTAVAAAFTVAPTATVPDGFYWRVWRSSFMLTLAPGDLFVVNMGMANIPTAASSQTTAPVSTTTFRHSTSQEFSCPAYIGAYTPRYSVHWDGLVMSPGMRLQCNAYYLLAADATYSFQVLVHEFPFP